MSHVSLPARVSPLETASDSLQKGVNRWALGRFPSNVLQTLCEQHHLEVPPTGRRGKKNKVDFLTALYAYVSHRYSLS
jgi:hypothetical protein